MRTAKLVNLGSLVLALCAGPGAWADLEAAPAADTATAAADTATADAETAAAAAGTATPAAPAEAPADAAASQGGVAPAAEQLAPVDQEMSPSAAELAPASEAVAPAAEAMAPAADAQAGAVPPEGAPGAPAADAKLGAVGYDEQGRAGRIHVVVSGDTLWDISDAYLGTPWVWPSIWQDNQAIENPHLIYPGDRIWITPWEMRKVTEAEAEALLAGQPAAPEPELAPPATTVPPLAPLVRQERPTYFVSNREAIGLVSAETVDAAASVLENVEKRLMISQSDRVWVGLGSGETAVGDQYTIFRVQEKVYDPETNRLLGYHVNLLGWAEIGETDAETSLAIVRQSSDEIVVGDRLMPRVQELNEIAIQAAPAGVEGQISFMARQRTHVGTMDYVYLNRGTVDGVQVGTPLEVYREGYVARDQARDEKVAVPDRVVADLLVVRAADETSVALIRHTEEELGVGDHFRSAAQ
jgi:hypothetical protein